jgi:hypothetical protein
MIPNGTVVAADGTAVAATVHHALQPALLFMIAFEGLVILDQRVTKYDFMQRCNNTWVWFDPYSAGLTKLGEFCRSAFSVALTHMTQAYRGGGSRLDMYHHDYESDYDPDYESDYESDHESGYESDYVSDVQSSTSSRTWLQAFWQPWFLPLVAICFAILKEQKLVWLRRRIQRSLCACGAWQSGSLVGVAGRLHGVSMHSGFGWLAGSSGCVASACCGESWWEVGMWATGVFKLCPVAFGPHVCKLASVMCCMETGFDSPFRSPLFFSSACIQYSVQAHVLRQSWPTYLSDRPSDGCMF